MTSFAWVIVSHLGAYHKRTTRERRSPGWNAYKRVESRFREFLERDRSAPGLRGRECHFPRARMLYSNSSLIEMSALEFKCPAAQKPFYERIFTSPLRTGSIKFTLFTARVVIHTSRLRYTCTLKKILYEHIIFQLSDITLEIYPTFMCS